MEAIKGIYDGKQFIPLENFPKDRKYKIIITFIEELNDETEIRVREQFANSNAFEFWQNEAEDLYQDYLQAK